MKELEEIDGLGPKTKLLFEKLGIKNIEDLITYYPKKYNIIKRSNMENLANRAKVIIDGIVETTPTTINISIKLKKIIFRISNNRNIYNRNIW